MSLLNSFCCVWQEIIYWLDVYNLPSEFTLNFHKPIEKTYRVKSTELFFNFICSYVEFNFQSFHSCWSLYSCWLTYKAFFFCRLKDSKPVVKSEGERPHILIEGNKLIINRASDDDVGTYTCQLVNPKATNASVPENKLDIIVIGELHDLKY